MNKTNVLLIDNSQGFTGGFKSALTIATQIKNHTIIFCIPAGSDVKKILDDKNIKYYEIPFLELNKNIIALFYIPILFINTIRLFLIIQKENIKIIHVNDMYNLCGVLIKIIRPKCMLIYHIRLLKSSYIRPIYKYLSEIIKIFSDEIIFVSKAVEADFGSRYNSKVIYDCMTDNEASQNLIKQDTCKDLIDIFYISNFTKGKGQDIALKIFKKVYQKNNKLRLHFVGEASKYRASINYYNNIKNLANELINSNLVIFHGYVNNVATLLNKADIYLHCSESESFSYTTLEALQQGLPVVVMDSGGIRELFIHGESGILIPLGDVDEAVKVIIELSNNLELRTMLAQNGRKYVTQTFNLEKTISLIEAIYDTHLSNQTH